MRVLFVVHMFWPEHRAGVETYTWQLARGLMARGIEVRVLTARKVVSLQTGTMRHRSLDGLEIVEVTNNLDFETPEASWAEPAMERAFRAALDDFGPDLVHVQHLMHWSVALPGICREAGIPVMGTLHDYWMVCGRMGQLIDAEGARCPGPSAARCGPCLARTPLVQGERAKRWIRRASALRRATGLRLDAPLRAAERWRRRLVGGGEDAPPPPAAEVAAWSSRWERRREDFRRAARDFDLLVTPSAALAAILEAEGVGEGKIRRLPQGLDHDFVGGRTRRPRRGPVRLGFVGTLAPHKGVHVLLEAFARLPAGLATLAIHGPSRHHPDYAAGLVARAAEIEGASVGGPLDRAALADFLVDLDLLCVPSLWNECCPLTIQEAAIAGTPSAVSGIGGMAELVRDGVDGLQLPPGDVGAWAAGLEAVVRAPERLDAFRAAMRPVPTLDEHLEALLELYRERTAVRPADG
ncbi:MAG: glycosyltransferase [Planctomycetota bacterium]